MTKGTRRVFAGFLGVNPPGMSHSGTVLNWYYVNMGNVSFENRPQMRHPQMRHKVVNGKGEDMGVKVLVADDP